MAGLFQKQKAECQILCVLASSRLLIKLFLLFWCFLLIIHFTKMRVEEKNENYDKLVCFIQFNENPESSEQHQFKYGEYS